MNRFKEDVRWILQHKWYVIALALTAVCSYGYCIVTPSIGVDDTAVPLYLEDGLEVAMGRWTIFLLNKLFHVSTFAPFMTELVGVLFLLAAAVVFSVLLRRLTGNKTSILALTVFSCVFISNPIISEVFVYYWHDGAGLGYLLTGLALLCFEQGISSVDRKKKMQAFAGSLLLVWVAVGCYESFLILYILGVLVVVFLWGMEDAGRLKFSKVFGCLFTGMVLTVGCVLLRTLMINGMTAIGGFGAVLDSTKQNQRSLFEMAGLFGKDGLEELIMLIKRFWVVYHLNAVVYLPVTVYEIAVFIFGITSVILLFKKKNIWFPVLYVGMLIAPFLLTLAEMWLSHYRSCQYLPFFAATGIWLVCDKLLSAKRCKKLALGLVVFVASVIIWNQAEYMNRSFYADYKRYENSKEVLLNIAYDIEREYGSDVPVIFTGHYSTPHVLSTDYYVSYGSWQYRYIAFWTDLIDPHLKEKYYSPWGYSFVGEANYPMILWAIDAFDGTNRQIMNFYNMHGHSFQLVTDPDTIREARELGDRMPGWPAEGSITKQNGYVLVHIMD